MSDYTKLLNRQLRRFWQDREIPDDLRPLLDAVNASYAHYETDRVRLERAMELSSQELNEANARLRGEAEQQQQVLAQLQAAILSLQGESAQTAPEATDVLALLNILAQQIEQQKQVEAILHEARVAAEAASKAKSDFLANMSHEIRTPMNGIIGMTELSLGMELDARLRENLSIIHNSAWHLMAVINDILDFSKIEAGHMEIEAVDFNLRKVLESTLEATALQAHQKKLELISDVEADLPACLTGDPARLRQVLNNLLDNAIKFTQRGEIVMTVRRLEQTDSDILLAFSVSDTGIGILWERQTTIFDSFTQADTSMTREYGGTGLGLTIARRLTDLMGGEIWLESEYGYGSTFGFTLPFKMAATAEPLFPEIAELAGKRVLVTDDNATNRLVLRRTLENYGFEVTEAEDGLSALTALETAALPFDLILLDYQMPKLDGMEFAELIHPRREFHTPPIILLTSLYPDNTREERQALNIRALLTKPVKQSLLLETIARVFVPADDEVLEDVFPSAETAESPTTGKLHILVVEDNAMNCKVVGLMLEGQGHTVEFAENGREGLKLLSVPENRFDVVLMDIQMPVMDGMAATRAIREREVQGERFGGQAHQFIIALTAHAMEGDRERCLEAGMDDYLSKPVSKHDLINVLARFGADGGSPAVDDDQGEAINLDSLYASFSDKPQRIAMLIDVFLEDLPAQMDAISSALQAGNALSLAREAHGLKSALHNFGAYRAGRAAARLEQLGAAGHNEQLPGAFRVLQAEVERTRQALEIELQHLG